MVYVRVHVISFLWTQHTLQFVYRDWSDYVHNAQQGWINVGCYNDRVHIFLGMISYLIHCFVSSNACKWILLSVQASIICLVKRIGLTSTGVFFILLACMYYVCIVWHRWLVWYIGNTVITMYLIFSVDIVVVTNQSYAYSASVVSSITLKGYL